jgi:hypothetical protein
MAALEIAQLAIYALLATPTMYCLLKHGLTGILGWLYLLAFYTLRLVVAGMENSSSSSSSNGSGTLIVENIGLTPLLLGSIGVLHEAYAIISVPLLDPMLSQIQEEKLCPNNMSLNGRATANLIKRPKIEWLGVLVYHIIVSSGISLMATGISDLGGCSGSSSSGNLKAGFGVIFLCWLLLTVWALWSWPLARCYSSVSIPYSPSPAQNLWFNLKRNSTGEKVILNLTIKTCVLW